MPPADVWVDPLYFEGIGTQWRVDTPQSRPGSLTAALLARVEQFDRDWSRFRTDSLVAEIARRPGRHRLPAEAEPLLDLYERLFEASLGTVNPLVGSSLEQLGYGGGLGIGSQPSGHSSSGHSSSSHLSTGPADARPTPAPNWASQVLREGRWLTTMQPLVLDVGAAGKGLLVDLLSDILLEAGVSEHVVDGSGDLLHRGSGALRVALEHPLDPTRAVGVVELRGAALAASASNRRRWGGRWHHIIDATTGAPVEDVLATWVVADRAMVADGVATALFTTAPERLAGFEVEWVRMWASGRLEASAGFEGELFA